MSFHRSQMHINGLHFVSIVLFGMDGYAPRILLYKSDFAYMKSSTAELRLQL